MRVISAIILSRGSQNEQTLDLGRAFLTENKLSIVAVLKRSAGIGVRGEVTGKNIDELADSYMLLMSLTGFLDASTLPSHSQTPC
jgi:nuclear pore complex protein Nup205